MKAKLKCLEMISIMMWLASAVIITSFCFSKDLKNAMDYVANIITYIV